MDASQVRQYVALTKRKAQLDAQVASVAAEMRAMEDELYGSFASQGIDRLTVDGTTVYLHRQVWARPKEGVSRREVVRGLRDAGLTEFISESFNYNTLSAHVREYDQAGEDLPEPLQEVIDVTEVFSVRTRKSG